MLSIYLIQSSGYVVLLDKKASSSCPMYTVARAGASSVPIANCNPHVCAKVRVLNLKMLLFKTYSKDLVKRPVVGDL